MKLALQIKDLTVDYGGFTALDRINLNLEQHTTLGLVGESGSGKSTLARVIAGLIAPNEGQILLGTQELKRKEAVSSTKQSR